MAEHNPRLKPHRDGLETIINRAMDFVQEASASRQPSQGSLDAQQPDRAVLPEIAESLPSLAPPSQLAVDNAFHETTERFDSANCDLFSDLHDMLDLQGDMSSNNMAGLLPFHGIFTEDFWAADAFNLPTIDGFGWRS